MKLYKRLALKILSLFGFNAVRFGSDILLMTKRTTPFERATCLKPLLLDQHLASLFDLYRVNCVLDVGAHRGQYALTLRNLGYTGHILSFEPVTESFELLQELARCDEKWSVNHFALGDNEHRAKIQVTHNTNFSSLLTPNPSSERLFGKSGKVSRIEEIEVKRLDSVFDDLCSHIDKPRVYLKMDTQGYDLKVFDGLGSLTKNLVGLQSEVSAIPIYDGMPDMLDAIALYKSHGFELTGLFPVSYHDDSMRVVEFDCVMVQTKSLE